MAEATMIGIFNAKISAFNAALNNNDRDAILNIGIEIIKIALEEAPRPNTLQPLRETYIKQAKAVLSHLANLERTPAPVATVEKGEEGTDPYYTEKDWFSDEVPNLNFSDIIGVQEVKDAFMVDVVAPLRAEFQAIYRKFRGNQLGTQLLLFGPPGTGKTHIVKCLAGVLGCKIAVVQASEVLASVVGVAEKNIRDVFKQASELDKCVIFLDEIDALCSDRTSGESNNTKSVLTTLLTCMDGFAKTTKPGQLRIIVAATNLPWKLDPALKRGGRFETQIYVPLPDLSARKKFVEKGIGKLPHAPDVTVDWLAAKLDGYSGADINAILRQIANKPLRRAVVDIIEKNNAAAEQEQILLADCEAVIKNYINPVNREMLLRFEAYDRGISFEELLKFLSRKQDS